MPISVVPLSKSKKFMRKQTRKFSKVLLCEMGGKLYALKKYEKKLLTKKREFHKSSSREGVKIISKYDDLKKELKIIADIKNEYCLCCEEILASYDEVYIVSKYMENECILKYDHFFFVLYKEETTFVPIPVIKCMIKNVLQSFLYIHAKKNICHRDVKPSNILLGKNGETKLCDFGESQYMTNKKVFGTKGTYEFMPPEFFMNGSGYYGEKVDMWSLGICLYALFYRMLPFTQRDSLIWLFRDIGRGEIKYHTERNYFLSQITKKKYSSSNGRLSNEDINFLKLFLKKNPAERFTAEEALVRNAIHTNTAAIHTSLPYARFN
ncbi:protein kinase 7, putative (PK7) [Plasmodium ovale curtisi]|uniref:mitogen-activated protein kinase kinase n=1 Tax=Plasmodium ovale curtisi TaxID=864141 RepID=A0A1A8VP74_PLAOA|nr:protein kinase 7, putative (PK7) [Plasmodium ovale curtisi]